MEILDILASSNMNIEEFFYEYNMRKKDGRLYSKEDYIPQNLIKLYYLDNNHSSFKTIIDAFKKKTVYNENEMELVHDEAERDGLALVYDAILSGKYDDFKNIYVVLLIHSTLYSCVPYKSFGGKFRNYNGFISQTDVAVTNYQDISSSVQKLDDDYKRLLELASLINKSNSPLLLINYMDECIKLKCKLIKIHPFGDGNGRTCRCLVNIMFKSVSLPPVYVASSERNEYIEAMDLAVTKGDYSLINKFYYYKICDSIYELDIINRDSFGKNKTK